LTSPFLIAERLAAERFHSFAGGSFSGAFSPALAGKDSFYQFDLKMGLDDARAALDQHGIEYRTLIPHAEGVRVAVFDPGTKHADNIGKVASLNEGHTAVNWTRGSGEFIGAETREDAHTAYQQVIQQYEGSHDRH